MVNYIISLLTSLVVTFLAIAAFMFFFEMTWEGAVLFYLLFWVILYDRRVIAELLEDD